MLTVFQRRDLVWKLLTSTNEEAIQLLDRLPVGTIIELMEGYESMRIISLIGRLNYGRVPAALSL